MRAVLGRLSDGRTAASRTVQVVLGATGLEITAEGTDPEVWAFGSLRTATPILKRSRDVLLGHAERPGVTLFVDEPAFPAALVVGAPGLSAGSERWHILRPMLMVSVVAGLGIGAVWALDLNPSQAIARLLPEAARDSIGQRALTGLTENRRVCETPESKVALDRLVARLAGTAETPKRPLVQIVDWGLVNAFAVPGRRIVLMRGLIARAQTPDEVAGVLAHEIGHTIELHPETGLVRGIGIMAGLQLMFTGSPGTLANAGALLAQLRYTRIAEQEADEHALRLLRAAGISANGLAQFFERMEAGDKGRSDGAPAKDKAKDKEQGGPVPKPGAKAEAGKPAEPGAKTGTTQDGGYGERVGEILRTHPVTASRIARIKQVPAYAATPALSPADWQALKTACGPAAAAPGKPDTTAPRRAPEVPLPPPDRPRDIRT